MWNDARTTNLIANTLAVLAVLAMLAAGLVWLAKRPYFDLTAIELEAAPGSQLHYVSSGLNANALTLKEFVVHLVPSSIVGAMASNEILQIVVFAAFFSIGLTTLGEKAQLVVRLLDQVSHVMLKVTGYVMALAPFAVFGAIANVVTTRGVSVLVTYGRFMGEFYASLIALWLLLILAGGVLLGRRVFALVRFMRVPMLIGPFGF